MAHGKSLELAQIRPVPGRHWTPEQWGRLPGHVPGDPAQWPAGMLPRPRRARRQARDGELYVRVGRFRRPRRRRRNQVG